MSSNVELFKKPLKIKEALSENKTEMSEFQLSMLCGLLKKYQPKKILEVGVAAGGTTAVILNCICMLNLDTILYSVDISEQYYRDTNKETGYLAEECKRLLEREVRHKQFTGKYLPEYLDVIGKDIDFLILDTMHVLPGELLDFLAAFPYLKEGAVVVLHDTFLNHYSDITTAFATRVLLSSVVGEKLVGRGSENRYNYIELGAFEVTQDTKKYIENVFSALLITWNYLPDSAQINIYRDFLTQHYEHSMMEEFDMAVEFNKNTLSNKYIIHKKILLQKVFRFLEELSHKESIFIYGCGLYGRKLYTLLELSKIKVKGFVISDNQVKPSINQRINYISEVEDENVTVVLGLSTENQKEVCKENMKNNWICIEEDILYFLRNNL